MENISLVIAVNQLGITVCSLVLGAVAEPTIAHLLEPALRRRCTCPSRSCTRSRSRSALSIVVYLHVVMGEMIPKNIALAGPDRAALVLGAAGVGDRDRAAPGDRRHQRRWRRVILRLVGVEPMDEVSSTYTREEVAALVEESRGEGLLEKDEYDRLAGALGFTEKYRRGRADAAGDADHRAPRLHRSPTSRRSAPRPASAGSRSRGDDGRAARLPPHQGRAGDRRGAPAAGRSTTSGSARSRRSASATRSTTRWRPCSAGAPTWRSVVDDDGRSLGLATLEDVIEELVGEIRDAAHQDEPA